MAVIEEPVDDKRAGVLVHLILIGSPPTGTS